MKGAVRTDFERIAQWVEPESSVLDLGCSNGGLLMHLEKARRARGYGIDIDDEHVVECLSNGVWVEQFDIDHGLGMFSDNQFDYVILSQTLQGVKDPVGLLDEMMRVGSKVIVSFPNFGHWPLRKQLLFGRMPVSKFLPYQWHDTPNIRFCTILDFEILCKSRGIRVLKRALMTGDKETRFLPNLRAALALYLLSH